MRTEFLPFAQPDISNDEQAVVENYEKFGHDHLGDEHIFFNLDGDAQIMAVADA